MAHSLARCWNKLDIGNANYKICSAIYPLISPYCFAYPNSIFSRSLYIQTKAGKEAVTKDRERLTALRVAFPDDPDFGSVVTFDSSTKSSLYFLQEALSERLVIFTS